jgi:hypothetical protein
MLLAIIFIVLGLFALLSALGIVVGTNFWSLIWAVVLLAIGFRLLRKRGMCPMCGWNHFEAKIHQKFHEKMQNHNCNCGCDHDYEQDNEHEKEQGQSS